MDIITNIFVLIFGALLGSFFNMLIYRLPRELNFVTGRSKCPNCNHKLSVFDLIPVFSYIFLLGRCRFCKKSISPRYLVCEVFTAVMLLFCFNHFGPTVIGFKTALFLSGMIILFFTDLETYILPDTITIGFIVIGFGLSIYSHTFLDSLYGFLVGSLTYYIIGIIGKLIYKQEAMGLGDVKLGGAIGAFWGLKIAILSCYLSFIIGGTIGGALLLLKIKKRKDKIPFGPMIILGSIIAIFYCDIIWNMFFKI